MKFNLFKWCVSGFSLVFVVTSLAEAPVVDIQNASSAADETVNVAQQVGDVVVDDAKPATQPDEMTVNPAITLPATPVLTEAQRLAKLEQQITNIINMNLPQQLSDLQEQVAQLRGQLQVQTHDIKLLNNQLRSFYQDLNNRINQIKNLNDNDSSDNSSSSMNNAPNTGASNDIQLKDTNAYQGAFQQLSKHRYDKAKQAFQSYLSDYPNGQYVANAHYWLGEIYLMTKDQKQAEKAFNIVVAQYPKSAKVADAKLKLAIIHANSGRIKQAKQELATIKKEHPNSTAAQLATIRLQQIEAQSSAAQ